MFVFLIWFVWKRQYFRVLVYLVPLAFVLGMPPFGPYPEELKSRLYILALAGRGLVGVLIANTCLLSALGLFRKGNSHLITLRQRLWVLAYFYFVLFLAYSYVFEGLGLKEDDGSITHNILTAFYFTTMTWTTVGYGDVLPHDGWTRFFAALAALNGYAVLAMLIATLLPIFTDGERKAVVGR